MAVNLHVRRTMIAALEATKKIPKFVLETFFANEEPIYTPYVDIDVVNGKRRIATPCSRLGDGVLVAKNGYVTHSMGFPYFFLKTPISPQEIIDNRYPGEHIYQKGVQLNQSVQRFLAKMIAEFTDMVAGAEEKMAIEALTTGKIAIQGDGVDQEIDFNMPADHILAVGDLDHAWDHADADILGDLGDWSLKCYVDSGLTPNVVLLGSAACKTLLNNTKVRAALDTLRFLPGTIEPLAPMDGVQYIGWLKGANFDLKLYNYAGMYYNGTSDANLLDPKSVVLGSSKARTTRFYGPIYRFVDSAATLADGTKNGRYVPNSYYTQDGKTLVVSLESAPLPAVHQSNAFLTAAVLA